jgi:hypothetical protein
MKSNFLEVPPQDTVHSEHSGAKILLGDGGVINPFKGCKKLYLIPLATSI